MKIQPSLQGIDVLVVRFVPLDQAFDQMGIFVTDFLEGALERRYRIPLVPYEFV